MTTSKHEKLLKILLDNKSITQETKDKALADFEQSGGKIEDSLLKIEDVNLENIAKANAQIYNMPYADLSDKQVDIETLNVISLESAENYKIVCFQKDENGKIKIGMTDPENMKAMEAVNFLAKKENFLVEFYLISDASFNRIFKQYKNLEKEVTTALETRDKEKEKEKKQEIETAEERENKIKSAPVAKIVSVIIRHAVEGRASDIHIEPSKKESRIRYRIDGILHTSLVLPKNVHSSIVSRIKVLANLKLDETRIPQDGRIRLYITDREIDFRVSILPLVGDEKVVMRILDTTKKAPSLEKLGYSGRALRVVQEGLKETVGMFLVTGPTGSGKSTTLFAILNMLNQEGVNISTLEDPVEYFIKGVNQSQIRPEIGFTFAGGLRALLRQDPDVIMVGEIRDNETAELAIHAGLTGHFVLSTLHTNSAVGAIPRLIDMKVEPFLLGSTLNVVAAQRLARRICKFCKEEYELPPDILKNVGDHLKSIPPKILEEELKGIDFSDVNKIKFYKGKGCARCGNTGYIGRIAIVEIYIVDDGIKKTIIDREQQLEESDLREEQGFITMEQDGIIKAVAGKTTMEEVLRIIND